MPTPVKRGECFKEALMVARLLRLREWAPEENIFVVHGLPIGTGPENLGKLYPHAWVEVRLDTPGLRTNFFHVYAMLNGDIISIPIGIFTRLGN